RPQRSLSGASRQPARPRRRASLRVSAGIHFQARLPGQVKNSLGKRVGRRALVGALAALLPLTAAAPAHAAPSDKIDQSMVLNFWLGGQTNYQFYAQTF